MVVIDTADECFRRTVAKIDADIAAFCKRGPDLGDVAPVVMDLILEVKIHRDFGGETFKLHLCLTYQVLTGNRGNMDILCKAGHNKAKVLVCGGRNVAAGFSGESAVGRLFQREVIQLGHSCFHSADNEIAYRTGIVCYGEYLVGIGRYDCCLYEAGEIGFNLGREAPMMPVFLIGITEQENIQRLDEVFVAYARLVGLGAEIPAGESQLDPFSGEYILFRDRNPLARGD